MSGTDYKSACRAERRTNDPESGESTEQGKHQKKRGSNPTVPARVAKGCIAAVVAVVTDFLLVDLVRQEALLVLHLCELEIIRLLALVPPRVRELDFRYHPRVAVV